MRKIVRILMIVLTGIVAVQAEDASLNVPIAAAVDGGVLVKIPTGEILIDLPGVVSQIAWNEDGSRLAMLVFDEELHLYTADFDGNVTRLKTGALEGFPPTFSDNGDILYVEIGENRVLDPAIDYKAMLMKIAPEADTQPEQIGTFSLVLECDGGSSNLMEGQYWRESGFLGNAMMLQETRFGILHSASCGGMGYGLLDPATGIDRPVAGSEDLARAALSLDGQTLAAVRITFNPPDHIRSLVIVDLDSGEISGVKTVYQPDQVAWGLDTAIYYSARKNIGDLMQSISPEEQAIVKKRAFNQEPSAEIEIPNYSVKIQQFDPARQTAEVTVYEGAGFAIGRMAATPEGLLFSQVANGDFWIRGVLDGTITMQDQNAARAAVPVTIHLLDLMGEPPERVGQGMAGFVVEGS
jgi:hypothetical protein